jgi:hypothetical protein
MTTNIIRTYEAVLPYYPLSLVIGSGHAVS